MSEAIRLVRDELGPDAVILNTETAGKTVKITAALDRAAMLEPAPLLAPEPMDSIAGALDFHRVPELLMERLMHLAENFLLENPRQALGAALRARFAYSPILARRPERPVMLVGLPGAGKTATLAKLAAGAKAAKWPVVAVTCDLAKAGGIDQLATYAKAMGITAYQARNAATLRRAIAAAPEGAVVLIDTAGSNPLKQEDLAALGEFAAASKAEPILTLAAGGDVSESAEQGQLFAELGCQRLIATRIDAARRYGGVLAAAEAGKLGFAEFGISPEIGSGLMAFGADALARLLMPQEMAAAPKPGQNDETARVDREAVDRASVDRGSADKSPVDGGARRRPDPGRNTGGTRKRPVGSRT
ncbi:MAG TPA: AAA family ATPase [Candidatus Cybelea sp.]|nr:AAA family ATPase [Candidatus Cybelea sp.]